MKKCIKIIFILIISFIYTDINAANNWHYTVNDPTSNKRIEVGQYENKDSCEAVRRMLDPKQDPSPECYESKPLKINKINPTTAAVGDFIEIIGEDFGQITSILFGSIPSKEFTFTDKLIRVKIPNGVNTGNKITLKSTTRGETISTEFLTIGESNSTVNMSSEILWWFTNEKLQIVGVNGVFSDVGFRSKNECDSERIKYIENNPMVIDSMIEECFEKDSKEASILARDQRSMEIYEVSKKTNESNTFVKEKYTLLAPIGDFTEFDGNDIGDYLNLLVKLAIGLCGALAVIMLIVNGVSYMGEGSIFKKTQAKDNMQNAILGLLIALGSWAILNTINPDLLGGRGLSVRQATIDLGDVDAPSYMDTNQSSSVGINCPKTGGFESLPEIAQSFKNNMTYSQDIPKGQIYNGKIKQDCSGFANAVLICSGINPKINSGTYDMFSSSYSEKITSIESNSINGIPLKVGDLIGWKMGDNPNTKHSEYGHVFVYIGNGKMVDSHGGTKEGGAYGEFSFPGGYKDYLKYIIRMNP